MLFELFLPFVIGTAMGLSPSAPASPQGAAVAELTTEEILELFEAASRQRTVHLAPEATSPAEMAAVWTEAEVQEAVDALQAALGPETVVTLEPSVEPVEVAREPEPQVATGQFTTALEVKPILGMTQGNWVALRLYDGQDLLYFTHLASWRCGLWEVKFGINGAPPEQVFALEPCYIETAQPNAMVDMENYLPYLSFAAESVETVIVEVTYDDGSKETARFARNQVLMPG